MKLVGGVALLEWAGSFTIGLNSETALFGCGFAVASIGLALVFGRLKDSRDSTGEST